MSIKLRDLIRNVRACKTMADERAVILKECALCRTSFKDPESKFRHRNVAKLLFIHMLGYPTHFARMECLKLIASPSFPHKRIGYLALMVLLDEKQDVLMLVTNSLKNDLQHKNPYIVGLALCSLGNISSVDMSRDLAGEVEKVFRNANPYLRKKAALCAVRIVRKVPDLVEDFVDPAIALLVDKNHAVLLTAITLMIEMNKLDTTLLKSFRKIVPSLVRLLKNLVSAGYVSEYDVVGITDPFLQTKIIELLRILGTGDADASNYMNDILAQVAINTEPTKNPGNAILYECVMTIMSIEAEGGLRVLAINILGRFLLNRDNNIRYVALNTLCKVVHRDTQAIQRHRNTVVDCLKDADISIRRRALDLIYALVKENNVKPLVKELLNYLALTSGDADFKTDLTEKICQVAERYAPDEKWHIDVLISVLQIAGSYTRENVSSDLILLITRSKGLYAFAVHKLYRAVRAKSAYSQLPLLHVGVWCIGEYGDLLISSKGAEAANADEGNYEPVAPLKVLSTLQKIARHMDSTLTTKEYVLNALIKLSGKFADEPLEKIKKIIHSYKSSMALELQQRSCEYSVLATMDEIRVGVVGRMPVLPKKKKKSKGRPMPSSPDRRGKSKGGEESADDTSSESGSSEGESESEEEEEEEEATDGVTKPGDTAVAEAPATSNKVLDLEALFGGAFGGTPAATPATTAPASGAGLMDEVFGAQPTQPAASSTNSVMDLFNTAPAPAPPAATTEVAATTVYESNGLTITFAFKRNPATPSITLVLAQFTNSTPHPMTNWGFQVAVPKHIALVMKPSTGSTLPPYGQAPVQQQLKLDNSMHGTKKVVVKVKLSYQFNGEAITDTATISKFPA